MFKLVPEWAHDYEAFWQSMRNRNLWFIHIRYGAVLMLGSIFLIASYFFNFNFSEIQKVSLISITAIILLYNITLHWLRKYLKCTPGKFNPLHFSLLQIVLDLITLQLLVYFTGSIETPLFMLFIFHMIIGSLILPGYVILVIALCVIFSFNLIVGLEYFNLIPHHKMYGVHQVELKNNFNFVFSSLGLFNFTIITAVLMTSRIAKRLYKRERELIETLKKLDEAEKAKQKYTMAVVHEIKSPIVAAQSLVEIIKNGYLGEISDKIKEKLSRTINRTDEALNLINNILRISKLKLLGEVTLEKINLREIIETLIEQKHDVAATRNIELEFDHSKFEDISIDGDKVLIELIASNVIGNAIKYNVDGGKVVVRLETNGQNILLDVSDSGIGIPESELKMIFQQFYRATNLPKKVDGSGLGLSLVKEIVERLYGRISIHSPSKIGSDKHPGTTVKIVLPMIQEEKE